MLFADILLRANILQKCNFIFKVTLLLIVKRLPSLYKLVKSNFGNASHQRSDLDIFA